MTLTMFEWVGHPVLGRNLEQVEADEPETEPVAAEPPSEVQLVSSTESDEPFVPAARDSAQDQEDAEVEVKPAKKTAAKKTGTSRRKSA